MMNWLLLILKILGILIAVVFGVILLAILLILCVPLCYRGRVCYGPQAFTVTAGISWLLFVLRVNISYLGDTPVIAARVFGIPVYRSDRKKQKERKKVPKTGKTTEKTAEKKAPLQTAAEPVNEKVSGKVNEKAAGKKETGSKKKEETKHTEKTEEEKKHKLSWNRINAAKELLSQEESKQAFAFAWDKLKRLLRHILPRKISGTLIYGSGDPCSTGQTLGIVAVLYARYGELLSITPDFEEKRLECDVSLKGNIQVFTLLLIAVKVITNKEIKQLIHKFKKLKTIE